MLPSYGTTERNPAPKRSRRPLIVITSLLAVALVALCALVALTSIDEEPVVELSEMSISTSPHFQMLAGSGSGSGSSRGHIDESSTFAQADADCKLDPNCGALRYKKGPWYRDHHV
mmetsp:Transcript_71105/g.167599  ORF Transcript_71105/g.167599 Transcript_71105/m.167599 type:complete len:116 (+) Transcript_71105:37-384(+)